jgi:hypothetical protein
MAKIPEADGQLELTGADLADPAPPVPAAIAEPRQRRCRSTQLFSITEFYIQRSGYKLFQ